MEIPTIFGTRMHNVLLRGVFLGLKPSHNKVSSPLEPCLWFVLFSPIFLELKLSSGLLFRLFSQYVLSPEFWSSLQALLGCDQWCSDPIPQISLLLAAFKIMPNQTSF